MKTDKNKDNLAWIIGFNDQKVRWIGIPLIGIIIPSIFFNISLFDNWINYLGLSILSTIHTYVFWSFDKWIVIRLRIAFPQHSAYIKRLFLEILIITITTLIIGTFSCEILDYIPTGIKSQYHPSDWEIYFASFSTTIFILSLYETMYFFDLWKISIIENEKLKTENTKAQLALLKNQVNPHFLFNSLNTLTSIIPENPKLATLFVEKLSAVYRYVLEIKNKELIQLKEEIKCIEAFEFLLKIRFGNKLNINMDIDKSEFSKYIVPMTLQMLIENAVKHNTVSALYPLKINISIENDNIIIKNQIKIKNQVQDSTNIGLENIKERYKIIADKDVIWTDHNDIFKVTVPLITVGAY